METIIMIGVIWNALLQTYWFFWSRSIHDRKHSSDEIDLYDKIKEYCDDTIPLNTQNNVGWEDFVPLKTKDDILNNTPKYNPDDIPGAFDDIFNKD